MPLLEALLQWGGVYLPGKKTKPQKKYDVTKEKNERESEKIGKEYLKEDLFFNKHKFI